jgi:DNA polymerase I-like protein with 3'-5' exonuclease and polymerase domains
LINLLKLLLLLLLQVAVILAKMEYVGVGIDPRHLLGHKAALKQRMAAITARAQQLAGSTFNLASSSQLAKVLYSDLGLPAPTGTGNVTQRAQPPGQHTSISVHVACQPVQTIVPAMHHARTY